MTLRILPPQMLLEIAANGGTITADMKVNAARFGLPRWQAARSIAQLASRKLLARDTERSIYIVAPAGWKWFEIHKPTAATPLAKRADDDPRDRAPLLDEVQRIRLEKQRKELRALARLRGVAKIDGVDHNRLYDDALELGRDANVTALDYRQLKTVLGRFPVFKPAGFSQEQAKALRDEINRPARAAAERKRKQAKAAAKVATTQTVADLDCRASAIYMVLTDQPQTMVEIMDKVARSPAFRTANGNSLLTGHCLRVAILRELKKPALAGRVEIKRGRYKNGRPMMLIGRRQ
jgi:hypothetical protein